ncbi:MAG: pseudouridylate synthase specific to ribosomal small subunit, rRNA pseudouridine2604 synthase [Candidatus Parcubacteria bacterium]|jgi:23S rRNA pseudouridine2604 synthase
MKQEPITYPMRINKYLSLKGFATRREADTLIGLGVVFINNKKAVLGQRVNFGDAVEVRRDSSAAYRYVAYYKPRGSITHSAQMGEDDVAGSFKNEGLFPVGRLDKDSEGLLILTNDGRITSRLLSPESDHIKQYVVTTQEKIRSGIPGILSKGMDTHLYGALKPAHAELIGDNVMTIDLSEGKKHQIRIMLDELHLTVKRLKRVKILNIKLGTLKSGQQREIQGEELKKFLSLLGL